MSLTYFCFFQISLAFVTTLTLADGTPPPGYKPKPQEPDLHPPKYEYGYNIADEKGTSQGKMEARDGIYAQGRYYVQGSSSSQSVQYLADDWGYHPIVEYSNVGPHSKTVTQIALGKEAVQALQNSDKGGNPKLQVTSTPGGITTERYSIGYRESTLPTFDNTVNTQANQPGADENSRFKSPSIQILENDDIRHNDNKVQEYPQGLIDSNNVKRPSPTIAPVLNIQDKVRDYTVNTPTESSTGKNLLYQHIENLEDKISQQGRGGKQFNLNNAQPILQKQAPIENIHNILLDQTQQNIQSSGLEALKENKQQVLVNQPQQIYSQPYAQQGQLTKNVADEQLKSLQNILSGSGYSIESILSNSQSRSNGVNKNENTIINEQGVPLIFLSQEQLNKGIVLLPQNYQTLQTSDKDYQSTQTEILNGKTKESFSNQNTVSTGIQEFGIQGISPIALPLVYNAPQQQSHLINGNQIQNGNQQLYQNFQTQLNSEHSNLESQNLNNLLQSAGKLDGFKQVTTAALYESGADLSVNGNSQENINYSGSYGDKINAKLINRPQYENNPSKLIETTKNLVNGLDVLSINGAAENVAVTPLSLLSDLSQQTLSISQSLSNEELVNANIISTTSTPILNEQTVTPLSLLKNPIIVADLENENTSSINGGYYSQQQEYKSTYSSAQNSVNTVNSNIGSGTTVVVTPKPVHSDFLAPIQAGIQLENAEKGQQQKFLIEVQESVPYYIGKFEYMQKDGNGNREGILQDINIGKTLINFPASQNIQQSTFSESGEKISSTSTATRINAVDQQQAQGQIQQITLTSGQVQSSGESGYRANVYSNSHEDESDELPQKLYQTGTTEATKVIEKIVKHPYPVEKVVEKPVHVPVQVTKYVDRPYPVHVPHHVPYPVEKIVEKYINRPYPVHVPVHIPVQVPVTVEKKVPVPYPVEKIVEKPVTKIVEKPVPQPYPVEKIVEKQVPVEVTKYIDRPYPVQVPVAQPYPVEKIVEKIVNKPYPVPVRVAVPQPYPVEKIVEKQVPITIEKKVPVPYPVEKIVEKPVTKIIEKPIPQPYPVEKIVEKQVPVEVTKYIDRPYAVKVPVAQPYPVERIVEKVVNKPYPVPVHVPVPQPYPVERIVEKQVPVPVNNYIDRPYPVKVHVPQPTYIVEKLVGASHKLPYQQFSAHIAQAASAVKTAEQNAQHSLLSHAYLLPLNIKYVQNNQQGGGANYQHFLISNPYLYAPNYQSVQTSIQKQVDQNSIASNVQDQKIQYVYQTSQPASLNIQSYNSIEQKVPSFEYGAPIPYNQDNCKTLNRNEYIGLVPPRDTRPVSTSLRKRQAKSSFESPKLEYGFLPPLVPSQEIDENGQPIESKSS